MKILEDLINIKLPKPDLLTLLLKVGENNDIFEETKVYLFEFNGMNVISNYMQEIWNILEYFWKIN